ncbi:glycoside hydrolase family 65 protein [Aquipuribacter sp. MA13-6]|uniref:glycoside hydrolase family 65 protein n=1 Tax=unclassified Aquipuribacter TaxID=2635084 RepID=UPI003EEE34F9
MLTYTGWDPAEEPLREALCTLGNGLFATRGAAPEAPPGAPHHPGTYVAGLYDRATTTLAGRQVENEDLVNAPSWLPLMLRVGEDDWLHPGTAELLGYEQVLDMRTGVLERRMVLLDHAGRRTSVTSRRLVHMGSPHLAALETTVRPHNWSGRLTLRSALDGSVRNDGVPRYRDLEDRHLETLDRSRVDDEVVLLRSRTLQSRTEVALAARTRLVPQHEELPVERVHVEADGVVGTDCTVVARAGSTVRVEKVVALVTSRHAAVSEPGAAAVELVRAAGDLPDLLREHSRAWRTLWERFDTDVNGSVRSRRALRLHQFHLLQTLSGHTADLDVGVPARGLHGEAYRGHVFWDELFVTPLLTYRSPELTRSLLRYRHRRLPAARRAARADGHRGAMFPWQSGSDGREESQLLHLNPRSGRWLPDQSWRQRHVGLAIAYEVHHYYEVTGDQEFLAGAGADLLVEVARFFADLATYDPATDRYRIDGVMGPDEFHDADPAWPGPGLRNNTYTNVLAAWLLAVAPPLLDQLPPTDHRAVRDRLELAPEELQRWDTVSRRLTVPFHADGMISQFEGYEDLEELDWAGYRRRYGDIARLDRILEAEGDTVNRYKASKQADVLMLGYLFSYQELKGLLARLGYAYDADLLRRTVDYYVGRTSHGSTLSNLVHSWVLARVERGTSLRLLEEALDSDISDVQGGTTAEGIHLGAMAGTVDMLLRGYSGLRALDGVLNLRPNLPPGLDHLTFRVRYRGRWVTVAIRGEDLEVESEPSAGHVLVDVRGDRRRLPGGGRLVFEGVARGRRPPAT